MCMKDEYQKIGIVRELCCQLQLQKSYLMCLWFHEYSGWYKKSKLKFQDNCKIDSTVRKKYSVSLVLVDLTRSAVRAIRTEIREK